ncbi:MAG: hypothetical protein R2766_06100 [Saprospiraceae bacterium]
MLQVYSINSGLCFIVQFSFCKENTATTCILMVLIILRDRFIGAEDSGCKSLPNNGCNICGTGISFADSLIDYKIWLCEL